MVPTHLFSSVTSLAHRCKNTEPSHPLAALFSYDCVISGSFSQILSPSVFSSGRLRWCIWTTHNKIRWNNPCSLNDELYPWNLHFIDGETETQQREWEVSNGDTVENSKSRQGHSLSSLHGVSQGQQCAGMVTRIYVCLYIYFLLLLVWDKYVKVIFFVTLLGSHYTLELTSSALRFCCCLVKNTQLHRLDHSHWPRSLWRWVLKVRRGASVDLHISNISFIDKDFAWFKICVCYLDALKVQKINK